MDVATIRAGRRTLVGTRKVSPLRAEGLIPAVLYGGGESSVNLAVEEREMDRHLRQHHKVFNLSLDGGTIPAYLKDIHWDVVTDKPLHMDFLRIDMSKPILTKVELAYIGHPVGASHGGTLVRDCVSLEITCLPTNMPEELEVKVKDLDVGDALHVSDLELPEGVTTEVPLDTIVCHVAVPSAAKTEEPAEGEETPEEGGEGGEGGDGDGEKASPKPEGE